MVDNEIVRHSAALQRLWLTSQVFRAADTHLGNNTLRLMTDAVISRLLNLDPRRCARAAALAVILSSREVRLGKETSESVSLKLGMSIASSVASASIRACVYEQWKRGSQDLPQMQRSLAHQSC